MFFTVYKTINLVNGRAYIGVHKTRRPDDNYLGSGKIIQYAIKKYGRENFRKEIIAVFDNAEEMYKLEAELVNENSLSGLMNLIPGGPPVGGINETGKNIYDNHAATVAPVLKAGRERALWLIKNDPEYRANNAKHLTPLPKGHKIWVGRKHKEETKKLIGQKNSRLVGDKNSQFGTAWVYSIELKVSKKIKLDEVDVFLDKGWHRGRKMKFD